MKFLTLILTLTLLYAFNANAEDLDHVCRAKAKETAKDVYRTCMTESRAARLEKIRTEFREKVDDLKKHYRSEVSKLRQKRKHVHDKIHRKDREENEQEIESEVETERETDRDADLNET